MCRFVQEFNHLSLVKKTSGRNFYNKTARKDHSVLIDTVPFEPIWIYKMLANFRSDLIEGSVSKSTVFERTPIRAIFCGQLRSEIMRAEHVSTESIQPFLLVPDSATECRQSEDDQRGSMETLMNKEQLEGLTSPNTN
ncbi:unnamed protein product [Phaedon cochleariae]|uniref:Uncharacterized protein n=1 Tax=Phaedon cochleariae TaxID=80249 RepID=A0A9N9SGI1_PHACE|nr:unnamed protein product [Phaedon cochleariae]